MIQYIKFTSMANLQTDNIYININHIPKYKFENISEPSHCLMDSSQESLIEFKQELMLNAEKSQYSVTVNGKTGRSDLKGSQILEKVVNPNSKQGINNFLVKDFEKAKTSPPKLKKSQTVAYLPSRPMRIGKKGFQKEVNKTMKRKLQQKMHQAEQKLAQLGKWYNFRKNEKQGILSGTIDATQSLNYLLSIGASPF